MNDITFQKTLASVMLDNKYDRFVKNRRTGKLDTKSLYKIETSNKLFKRREARKNKHYAVSLVVDCSGSMSGDKIKTAAKSAERLSWHLSRMGIPHNVVGFQLSVEEIKKFDTHIDRDLYKKLVGVVSQNDEYEVNAIWDTNKEIKKENGCGTIHPLFALCKGDAEYREKYDLARKTFSDPYGIQTSSGPGMNSDAEAVKWTRERIQKQLGRRIIILLSDGQPVPMSGRYESPVNRGYAQTDFDLRQEIKHTIDAGIELYSIGIMSDSVNHYYPARRTCSIKTLEQLYPHIIKLIKINLHRG